MKTVIKAKSNTSGTVTGVITKSDGTGLPASQVTTLKATLYDEDRETVINSRDEQDVLNANGGTLDESGNFELALTADDNPIIDSLKEIERHILLLEWTYPTNNAGASETVIEVEQITKP